MMGPRVAQIGVLLLLLHKASSSRSAPASNDPLRMSSWMAHCITVLESEYNGAGSHKSPSSDTRRVCLRLSVDEPSQSVGYTHTDAHLTPTSTTTTGATLITTDHRISSEAANSQQHAPSPPPPAKSRARHERERRFLRKVDSNGFEDFDSDPLDGIINLCVSFGCVLMAAIAAGLTIGLMSIDPLELEIKQRVGTPEEKRQASRILPIIQKHHLLLVTLLLYNSAANETLPLFLDKLVPTWAAVVLSVTMVLFMGEIIPSAIFSGKHQLQIASRLSGLVWGLMLFLTPIAYPIAWLLDSCIGDHNPRKRYTRAELSALIEIHQEVKRRHMGTGTTARPDAARRVAESGGGNSINTHLIEAAHNESTLTRPLLTGDISETRSWVSPARPHRGSQKDSMLSHEEVEIVLGVLKISSKTVADAYVPMNQVFCLSTDDILDEHMLGMIMASGYSRVPVYQGHDPSHIRGFLLVKRLIVIDPKSLRSVGSLSLRTPIVVSPQCPLIDLLTSFQEGRSHLAVVSADPNKALKCIMSGSAVEGDAAPLGIITLEDVIEEILQEEILDEHDRSREFLERRRLGARQVLSATLLRKQHQQAGLPAPPPVRARRSTSDIPPATKTLLSQSGDHESCTNERDCDELGGSESAALGRSSPLVGPSLTPATSYPPLQHCPLQQVAVDLTVHSCTSPLRSMEPFPATVGRSISWTSPTSSSPPVALPPPPPSLSPHDRMRRLLGPAKNRRPGKPPAPQLTGSPSCRPRMIEYSISATASAPSSAPSSPSLPGRGSDDSTHIHTASTHGKDLQVDPGGNREAQGGGMDGLGASEGGCSSVTPSATVLQTTAAAQSFSADTPSLGTRRGVAGAYTHIHRHTHTHTHTHTGDGDVGVSRSMSEGGGLRPRSCSDDQLLLRAAGLGVHDGISSSGGGGSEFFPRASGLHGSDRS